MEQDDIDLERIRYPKEEQLRRAMAVLKRIEAEPCPEYTNHSVRAVLAILLNADVILGRDRI